MRRYRERVSDVQKITEAMMEEGIIASEHDIENDHIAFRTMGVAQLGIQSFEKIFLHYGYTKRDYYFFEKKKLDAYWYAPPEDHFPRIFVSELRVGDLSEASQTIIHKYTDQVKRDPADDLDLNDEQTVDTFLHSPLWSLPTKADYIALKEESEYAAWVIYNRYYLNHYTLSVHNFPSPYHCLEAFNTFLEGIGIKLNSAGGQIKVSNDGLLRQSSSVAAMIDATFAEGEQMEIAGSYVEFAERGVLAEFTDVDKPEIKRIHRRDGFEAGNADKIFESTFSSQTNR